MENNFTKLLDFQGEVVNKTLEAFAAYDPNSNLFSTGRGQSIPEELKGTPKPYLHRIKAVTGAGKTPILAALAAKLKNCVILWTTPRGAVISQTNEALLGKYGTLLPDDTRIYELGDLLKGRADWHKVLSATEGCTIITATVASYNQDKDATNLLIHKGAPSPWEDLCRSVKRDKWVFYDEGHNVTEGQFAKLLELRPKGFILASASPLPSDLYMLIPGENLADKEAEFNQCRTTVVDTKSVVDEGLLKETIKIHDIEASFEEILKAAVNKREFLGAQCEDQAIACYMVDRDSSGFGVVHGLSIWEKLVELGVPKEKIAVHLSGARDAAEAAVRDGKSQYINLIASYDSQMTPRDLKAAGFRHIIWNLSLQEGWDEPWAYVGYFHGEQRNVSQVIQRIGRLIRNPFRDEGGMPARPESVLRTVHCYLRTPNALLKLVVDGLKKEMNTAGLDVFITRSRTDNDRSSVLSPALREKVIERLCLNIDKSSLQAKLLKAVTKPALRDDEHFSKGIMTTVSVDVSGHNSAALDDLPSVLPYGVPSTVGEVVKNHLELKDPRLVRVVGNVGSIGGWLAPSFWDAIDFAKPVHVSSPAYYEYKRRCDSFISDQLGALVHIVSDNDEENPYKVAAITLINPDGGADAAERAHYLVHPFQNAVHSGYNGLNEFELAFAHALDVSGLTWVRNPSRVGYGIPLARPAGSSSTFYPDFIVWDEKKVVFLETKGRHLWENFVQEKLKELPPGFDLIGVTEQAGAYQAVKMVNGRAYSSTFTSLSDAVAQLIGKV